MKPTYIYKCPNCEAGCEIQHSMDECDNPSEDTVMQTSCNENTCLVIQEKMEHEIGIVRGEQWHRVPQMFGMESDKLVNNNSKREKFLKGRRKRNAKHFDDEVMPKLKGTERNHFIKKRGFKS